MVIVIADDMSEYNDLDFLAKYLQRFWSILVLDTVQEYKFNLL